MGRMRFIVSPPSYITDEMAQQAYLSGLDRIPWETQVRYINGELVLERTVSEAGVLHIPWPVEGYGQLVLSTGTLMERLEPYHLPLELARGKIAQIRSQQSEWEALGLVVPVTVTQAVTQAVRYFGLAVQAQRGSEDSLALAERAIHIALTASSLLAACYAEQALAVRRRLTGRPPTLLGASLGSDPLPEATARRYREVFTAAQVPLTWRQIAVAEGAYRWETTDRQIQWCHNAGLTVCGGPLLQFDRRCVPDWLSACEGDFESLSDLAMEFVQATVERYRGGIDLWLGAGRVNTGDVLSLSEEEKVKLAARAVELVRSLDSATPILVSFDQPWAEYLSHRAMDFPPLHFADALLRAGLGLSGVMLEINVGVSPGGTPLRDPLDFSRQLDYWGLLGAPIYLTLTVPSDWQDDPLSSRRVKLLPGSWTPNAQQAWVSRYVTLAMAKAYVQGVFWNQLCDSQPHEFPHGGLFDAEGNAKPALEQLASLRPTPGAE